MSKPKNILVFIDWYRPGYRAGGPIRSLANLVDRLPFHFWIITSRYDHYSDTPYPEIVPGEWIHRGDREHVMYLERNGATKEQLKQILQERDFDWVYLNSLFSLNFALRPLKYIKSINRNQKVLLAPRGMLKAGALSVKARKKKAFLFVTRLLGLFKQIEWHATNQTEADEIKLHFGDKTVIRIAPNLPREASLRTHPPKKEKGKLKLVTIARVSPEKGTLEGLQAISEIANGEIEWHIYGTLQSESYVAECKSLAKSLKHTVHFHGEIEPTQITDKLIDAHFFYLTTLGENYGHAIAESLLSGVPVIISDRTPWQGLENENAGWVLPLEGSEMRMQIEKCIDMDQSDYLKYSQGAFEKGQQIAEDQKAYNENLALFE